MDGNYVLVQSPKDSVGLFEIDPENTSILAASTNAKLILAKAHAQLRLIPLRELGEWEYYILVYDNDSGDRVGQIKVNKSTTLGSLNFE